MSEAEIKKCFEALIGPEEFSAYMTNMYEMSFNSEQFADKILGFEDYQRSESRDFVLQSYRDPVV